MQRSQSGQASVVLLALLASLVGVFALSFGGGQLVNDKMRLVNAADAAAYSAALWEARSLNYQSYLNRAIVANEVAIAQLVSLRSWSAHVATLTRNGSLVAQWIPPLAVPVRTLERAWQAVDASVQSVSPGMEGALSAWNVNVLANAQAIAHQQASIAAADLVSEVARANEPRAQVSDATRILQVRNAAHWQRFTDRYRRGGGDLRRFVTLLMESRDGFTRSRRSGLSFGLVDVRRRGGTDLLAERSWRGIDSLSVHVNLLLDTIEVPIAWGAAEARSSVVNVRGEHGGSRAANPSATRRARRGMRSSGLYQGVPEIRDVTVPSRQNDRRVRYSVALQLPRQQILLPERTVLRGGIHAADGSHHAFHAPLSGGAIHAQSSAEVYFQRPASRADGRREYASLFSPYWQARLVSPDPGELQLAAAGRGLIADPFPVRP